MGLAVWAAYNAAMYPMLAITVVILAILGWLKYRLLKHVRQLTKNK